MASAGAVREPETLIRSAVEQTGFGDFGGDWFRVGLDVLVESVNADIELTETGVATIEGALVRSLSNRLRIEAWYRSHPEVATTPIGETVLVIGLPRSGTTALVGMLAEDRSFRALRQWEAAEPCPPPVAAEEGTDRRLLDARAMESLIPPELKALHIVDPLGPEEDHDLLGLGFRGGHFGGFWPVPRYTEWWLQCDMGPAFAYHERALKLLGSRRPPSDWLLKAPLHLFELEHFLEQYPNTRFVMTHRDPAKTIPSVCSLMGWSYGMVTDRVDLERNGAQQLAFWSEGVRRAMHARDRIGQDRFLDISHADLVGDPFHEIGRIYDFLGRDLTDETTAAIGDYAARNQVGGQGKHDYSAEEFGLDANQIRYEFAEYIDQFGLNDRTPADT